MPRQRPNKKASFVIYRNRWTFGAFRAVPVLCRCQAGFAPVDVPAQDDARQRFLLGPARRYVCEAEPHYSF
jgi:hypothetical protein